MPPRFAVAVFALALLAACDRPPETRAAWHQVDLCQQAPVEQKLTGWRHACHRGLETLQGRALRAVRSRPGGHVVWDLGLGADPRLSFRPAPTGSSCSFLVVVRDQDGERHVVLHQDFEPTGPNPGKEVHVDLSPFAGSTIRLVLRIPEGQQSCEEAHWVSPLVVDHRPLPEGRPARQGRPNILLLGIDTLRADALGPWRQAGSVTPAIDHLASESDVWMNAFTTINYTNPSFISLMTGLYPKNHGIYGQTTPLPAEVTTLAELLHEAGYTTRGMVSAAHLGASGLDQGFESFVSPWRLLFAETVVNQGITWLQDIPEPFFLWLHLYDPHVPHNPPHPYDLGFRAATLAGPAPMESWAEFREPGPLPFDPRSPLMGHTDLYPGEVAYVDRQVDRLLGFMESRGLLDETIVVLVADHGENLGEGGELFNHYALYDSTTHVPLVIHWPGARQGRRLSGLVQHLDLFPTLLEAAGSGVPERDGVSLTAQAARGRQAVFAEHSRGGGWMVRTPDYKLMILDKEDRWSGRFLFDLRQDPKETNNLAGTGLAVETELDEILDRWQKLRRDLVQPVALEVSEEERRDLEALGYVD